MAEDCDLAAIYAEARVKEYGIVLPETRRVEVHRRPEGGVYRERQIYADKEEIACTALPAVRVSLPSMFA